MCVCVCVGGGGGGGGSRGYHTTSDLKWRMEQLRCISIHNLHQKRIVNTHPGISLPPVPTLHPIPYPFEDSKVPYSNPLFPITYRHESAIILCGGMVRAVNISYRSGFGTTLATSIVILTFAGTGGQLTPRRVFTVLSLVTALRRTNFNFFVQALFQVSELRVAQVRIKVCSGTLFYLL